MRFSVLFSAFAFVASVVAQQNQHNAFNLPTDGTMVINAGQSKTLTWSNKAGNTVSLLLRQGLNSDLTTVLTIADKIPNSGTYTWNVPSTLPEGNSYAIEIVNQDDTSDVNYTGQFVIKSDVKAVASGTYTGVVTATSASLVTSQPTGVSVTVTTTGSATGSASGMTTMTGSSTGTAASSSGTGASSSRSASAASGTTAASGTVPTNAAARPAAGAAGALLAVAAGFAIAL